MVVVWPLGRAITDVLGTIEVIRVAAGGPVTVATLVPEVAFGIPGRVVGAAAEDVTKIAPPVELMKVLGVVTTASTEDVCNVVVRTAGFGNDIGWEAS